MRENIIMMTNAQKADRLALIREIAEKRNNQASFKSKVQKATSKVRDYTETVDAPSRRKAQNVFDMDMDRMNENYNQWTDASKYADQYYGDTMRATTRFDNDWD